ncbi:MAG: hypothetical protein SOV77_09585 [Lachnospiraceae bacterium]|nr:hypothetical protein [Lachnospiraceae bacterium]MDY2614252.1 hypothetical protein [Lachnospiraceae bacterium]MDY4207778.1 hypothetical protein [Lachnospiraceae bacterium]
MRTVGMTFKRKKTTSKKLNKEEVMKILTEKGIKFDENEKVEELLSLIPKE